MVKNQHPPSPGIRDIFLSHRSLNKGFVRRLAADIEAAIFQDRTLTTWLDEAEIPPGQSAVGMINWGLENSCFVGLVMTPEYFQSESGWTDAEWHAVLYTDPDNRRGRIIPLLAADCPYIPVLLRHLNPIDLRGNRYQHGLEELLRVLREEPLPRPISYRGQLITPGGRIDRATLIAERSAPQADPDVVSERLYCNLLPVEKVPQYVYMAPIAKALQKTKGLGFEVLPSKQEIKNEILIAQEKAGVERTFMPAFRLSEDKIITFHDLESPDGPFATVIEDEEVEVIPTVNLLRDEDDRRLVVSLFNMAIARHGNRIGLVVDDTARGRFFFPPKNGGPNIVTWTPLKAKSQRTVAKPCVADGRVLFWRHLAAYLQVIFVANKFYLHIRPTWVITEDGSKVRGGPQVGRLVIKWTGPERNLHVLYHVRFWTSVLRLGPGPISIRAGDQRLEISTVPAFVQQSYGIAYDQKDLRGLLDQEAPLIAEREEELADIAAEVESCESVGLGDEEEEFYIDDGDRGSGQEDDE